MSTAQSRPILVTGFEPFAGARTNPSAVIARRLHGTMIRGHAVVGVVLPCEFGRARRDLRRLVGRHRPALVVCLGLATGRTAITPERIAINVDDARIADNAGRRPLDRPVVRGGPAAYWSTLPVKSIVAALRRRQWPAAVSQTAGTFVCNHVFYGLMHQLRRQTAVRGGFVHVPRPRRGLTVADQTAAIAVVLRVAVGRRRDAKLADGATD